MAHADTDPTNPPPLRSGCLGLIVNDDAEILVVRPTYNNPEGYYQLPGGAAGEGEKPWAAVAREVREETGLHLTPLRLLVLDWIEAKPDGRAAGQNLVFWCGRIPGGTPITLPEPAPGEEQPELDDYRWVRATDLDGVCAPFQARRIRAALQARIHGTVAELIRGHDAYAQL
ncbi:NUDIX domain-containing protein [Streptomyces cacaoi]|uniref:NUDIX domain-containing protein n=1 Tax=Streptomyces cacaoi TaxID=1898 RepID=UPI00262A9405|nr:NUDIX hydrolase [Streptomyces cacaoi]